MTGPDAGSRRPQHVSPNVSKAHAPARPAIEPGLMLPSPPLLTTDERAPGSRRSLERLDELGEIAQAHALERRHQRGALERPGDHGVLAAQGDLCSAKTLAEGLRQRTLRLVGRAFELVPELG